jgi:transcriptional regulator with XRE-family HTH domain
MSDLGARLREAREAAGLSLAGLARRTGYSRSHLSNVETCARQVTPEVIKAYEVALGDDVNRRGLLIGLASTAAAAALPEMTTPEIAVDVVREIAAERSKLLASVQTDHATDRAIASLVARDIPCVGSLTKWMTRGSRPVLRVNAAGVLAKLRAPSLDNEVARVLKVDQETRSLYLSAVTSRVTGMPWDDASHLVASDGPLAELDHVTLFGRELRNEYDSAARWCSVIMLGRTRTEDPQSVDAALAGALSDERATENLRAIAATLAGLSPLTV